MQAVKVKLKGQVTLPKVVRVDLDIHEGDTLVLEGIGRKIVLKKGRTIFDYAGTLPNLGMSVTQLRERGIEEAVREDD